MKARGRFDFLDTARGIAILAVFVYHSRDVAFDSLRFGWNGWFADFQHTSHAFWALLPLEFGWAGVAIFFVVSGFCIHWTFQKDQDWRNFFCRRFFRIYPPYLGVLLFFTLVSPLNHLSIATSLGAVRLGSHLLLIHNFFNDPRIYYGISAAFWTIAVEWQLYLLYPLLLRLVRAFGWRNTLAGLGALELLLRSLDGVLFTAHGVRLPNSVIGSPFFYCFSWSIGAGLAEAHLRQHPLRFGWKAPAALILLGIASEFIKPLGSTPFMLFAMATAAVFATKLSRENGSESSPGWMVRWVGRIGVWSYSLYLLHEPLLWGVGEMVHHSRPGKFVHPLILFAACLVSGVGIIWLSKLYYSFCELPSIALGKRFLAFWVQRESRFPTLAPSRPAASPPRRSEVREPVAPT